jgi:hypothetical protein
LAEEDLSLKKSSLSLDFHTYWLGAVGLFSFAVFVAATAISNYLGVDLMEHLSFRVSDGWCEPPQGIGRHCFGDFGLAWAQSAELDPYVGTTILASNPPLLIVVFKFLFSPFPYNFALYAYLLLALSATTWSVFYLVRALKGSHSLAIVSLFLVLTSLGFLVAIDRGNHVWAVFPLIAWAIGSDSRGRSTQTIVALALLASIKFWGAVFLIVFLVRKQWRNFFATAGVTAALSVSSFLLISAEPFPGRLAGFVRGVLNDVVSREVIQHSISVFAFLAKVRCEFTVADCSPVTLGDHRIAFQPAAVILGLLLIGISIWAAHRLRFTPAVWLPLLLLPISALPEAGPYNLILLPVGFILVATIQNVPPALDLYLLSFFAIAVVLSMPFPLDFQLTPLREILNLSLPWKIQSVAAPITLGLFTLVTPLLLARQRAGSGVAGIGDAPL